MDLVLQVFFPTLANLNRAAPSIGLISAKLPAMRMILDIVIFFVVLGLMIALASEAGNGVFGIFAIYALIRVLVWIKSTKPRWQVEREKKSSPPRV